ncbi:MAG: hypothetical protein MUF54_04395 [Polyangiaceae bacterium]|jgi:hypothetical protein|nr:hypothetical protein [Polyangiaceae bacterium]
MAKPEAMDVGKTLTSLYDAERTVRELSRKLVRAPHGALTDALQETIEKAGQVAEEDERSLQLVCVTRILRSLHGPRAIDLLIDVLGSDSEEARGSAGLVLEDLACDRFGELRKGIDRAVKRLPVGHMALCELPFVILNFSGADTLAMLKPFMALQDAEAVAAGIEAMVELADPSAISLLEPLVNDERAVQVEDESTGDAEQLTVGDLAADAVEALREVEKIMGGED